MKKRIKEQLRLLHLEAFAGRLVAWTRRMRGRLAGFVGIDARIVSAYFRECSVRKLHIGCGWHPLTGWLNTDDVPSSREVVYLDATRPFPFSDSQFDYVFSEHMIEHIPFQKGQRLLIECNRVLKPGGKARIATPDLLFLINLYRDDKSALQQDYIKWSSSQYMQRVPYSRDVFVINNFFRDWGHQFIYDEKVLRSSMESAGFVDIRKCELGSSADKELCNLENDSRMPAGFLNLETFVLEGTKRSDS